MIIISLISLIFTCVRPSKLLWNNCYILAQNRFKFKFRGKIKTNKLSGKSTISFNKFQIISKNHFKRTCLDVDEIVMGIGPLTYSFTVYR